MRHKINKCTKLLYLFIVLAFMYLPIVFLAIASFDESKLGTGKGFTLKWYAELFSRSDVMDALWVTPVSYTHLDVYKRQAYAACVYAP